MSSIQSVLFKRDVFSSSEARKFLSKHGWEPIKRVHKTEKFLRYRIQDPENFKSFATKSILKGNVQLVIGFKRKIS